MTLIKFNSPKALEEHAGLRIQAAKNVLYAQEAIKTLKGRPIDAEAFTRLLNLLAVLQSSSKVLAEDVLKNRLEEAA